MTTLRVQATRTGRVVSYSLLKQGVVRDAGRWGSLLFTTTLPDVITDLLELCGSFDPQLRVEMVIPNGATSAALDMAIIGKDFSVICARRLVRGLFPLNPLAAERGSNYDVVVTVLAGQNVVQDKIVGMLQAKYACKMVC